MSTSSATRRLADEARARRGEELRDQPHRADADEPRAADRRGTWTQIGMRASAEPEAKKRAIASRRKSGVTSATNPTHDDEREPDHHGARRAARGTDTSRAKSDHGSAICPSASRRQARAGSAPRRSPARAPGSRYTPDPDAPYPSATIDRAPRDHHRRVRPQAREAVRQPPAIEPQRVRHEVRDRRQRRLAGQERAEQRERRQPRARPPTVATPAIVQHQRRERERERDHGVAVGDPAERGPVRVVERVEQERQPREPRRRRGSADRRTTPPRARARTTRGCARASRPPSRATAAWSSAVRQRRDRAEEREPDRRDRSTTGTRPRRPACACRRGCPTRTRTGRACAPTCRRWRAARARAAGGSRSSATSPVVSDGSASATARPMMTAGARGEASHASVVHAPSDSSSGARGRTSRTRAA